MQPPVPVSILLPPRFIGRLLLREQPVSISSSALNFPDHRRAREPAPPALVETDSVEFQEPNLLTGYTGFDSPWTDVEFPSYQVQEGTVSLYTDDFLPLSLSTPTSYLSLCTFEILRIGWRSADEVTVRDTEPCHFTSSASLNRDATLAARLLAIHKVQIMMRMPETYFSYTIAAVVSLALSDLCSGEIQDLHSHINGLSEMTQLKGGLFALGTDGKLAQMVLL